jgi:hypothetical protein
MQSTTSTVSPLLAYLAEFMGAALGGFVLAVVLGYGTGVVLRSSDLGMGLLALMVYIGIIGFGVGAAAGTAIAGRLLNQSGSFWLALAGSLICSALVAIAPRVISLRLGLLQTLVVALVVALIAAVVGYNLRRR